MKKTVSWLDSPVVQPPSSFCVESAPKRPILYRADGTALGNRAIGFVPEPERES